MDVDGDDDDDDEDDDDDDVDDDDACEACGRHEALIVKKQ